MPPCRFSAGIDASDYDWGRGPMDVAAAVGDGIVFFTHKATEGTQTQHVHYGEALNRARVAGMPCMGAYMIPRTPGNNGHGSIPQQVSYFLAYLDQQTPWWRSTAEFFIQVDTEHWGYDDVAPQYGAQACTLIRDQTGKFVVHYAPRWAYGDTIPGNDPLWASSYGSNPAVPYRQAYPGDNASGWAPYSGRTPIILQFGSRVTIGTQPSCDGNAFRGTLDQFRALVTGEQAMDERLLGPGFGPGVDADGNELHQGAGTLIGDWWKYYAYGTSFYVTGRRDPNGPASELYLDRLLMTIRDNAKAAAEAARQQVVPPTQEQIDAAVLKALQDQTVLKGIGDAIASHLHVT